MRIFINPFIVLMLLAPFNLPGQESPDSTLQEKEPGFMLASAGYTNNNSGTQLVNAIKMPALMTSLSYYSSFGMWVSGNFDKYLLTVGNAQEVDLQVGYEKTFGENLDLGVSYKNRQFRGNRAYEGVAYNHALDLSGAYQIKNLSALVDNSFTIGPSNNYFLDLTLSYDFKFDGLIFKSGFLAISPSISASFGTTYWMTNTMDHVWGNHYQMGNNMNLYVPEKNFDYQNASLVVPVQYALGSFILSAGWFYSIPSKTLKEQKWTNQSGFLISLAYSVIF